MELVEKVLGYDFGGAGAPLIRTSRTCAQSSAMILAITRWLFTVHGGGYRFEAGNASHESLNFRALALFKKHHWKFS